MANSENELNVSSKNFFGNNDIPYQLKAGLAAVLLHSQVGYHQKGGQVTFGGMLFDKDIENGKSNRVVGGSMFFTFGLPSSMAKDNCLASIKKMVELYPAVGDVLDRIAEGEMKESDEKICQVLADASAKRFILSAEGSVKNWENFISGNFDVFVKHAQTHYPGLVPMEVYDNLKRMYEEACKKKTIAQMQTQTQERLA